MTDISAESILPAVREIVTRAGNIIREHRSTSVHISHKGRIDLVTDTDLAVEDFLKRYLKLIVPSAVFQAEESSPAQAKGDAAWIIDPLDGTTNFAHDLPLVATSVALWLKGEVVLGIINLPLMGECFWAVRGAGAFCNGKPIQVSSTAELSNALVATGFPYTIEEDLDAVSARLQKVLPVAQGVRRCGAAAIDMAYVAAGRFDLYYEKGIKPWDVAAGLLLVEEAGGKISGFDGAKFNLEQDDIIASNAILHENMVELIKY